MPKFQYKFQYIIADHVRAACFLIGDGVLPGPKQQGYILRRLIRRSLSASLKLNIDISAPEYFVDLVNASIKPFDGVYEELQQNKTKIIEQFLLESQKYLKAVARGKTEWVKELKNIKKIESSDLSLNLSSNSNLGTTLAKKTWDLYQTHGVPIEVSLDVLEEQNLVLDQSHLDLLIESHQKLSQTTSAGQFKSGLGENNEITTKLHTTTHLLHQTLREVLGDYVEQRGSAITSEKARFDFTAKEKLTPEQLMEIQAKVQSLIDKALNVTKTQMAESAARELGAIGLFGEKYGETVTVYTVEDDQHNVYSREFCGGPHVQKTSEIGTFEIIKQESLGAGLRRLVFMVR